MGKLLSVRSNGIFSVVCQKPTDNIKGLKSALRSFALEADRVAIHGDDSSEAFRAEVLDDINDDDEGESYLVDRRIHHRSNGARYRGYRKGKRTPGTISGRRRFVPPDVCIICDKKGWHSLKHRNKSLELLLRAAKAFVRAADVIRDLCKGR